MILFEIAEFLWEHREEISINALLLLILRKFVMSEVHKLLHLGRDKEISWLLQRVEMLSGEKYNSQPDFWRTAKIHFIKNYYLSSLGDLKQVYQQRRKTKMQINKAWLAGVITFILAQIAERYGVSFPDADANAIAGFLINIVLPLVVAWMNKHKKGVTPIGNATQYKGDTGAAV